MLCWGVAAVLGRTMLGGVAAVLSHCSSVGGHCNVGVDAMLGVASCSVGGSLQCWGGGGGGPYP